MTDNSKRALAAVGLLIVILVLYILLHLPQPSEQKQIIAQMQSARAAAQDHDVNGIMQVVSANYQDSNGLNNDQLALLLRHLSGNSQSIQITLAAPGVQVTGDTAVSETQVSVLDKATGQSLYNQPLTLQWKKEDGREWLIFPTKVWRIVGATYSMPGGDGFNSFF